MEFNAAEFEKPAAKGIIQYFEQAALAAYLDQPNKYAIQTDYFEGRIVTTDAYYRELKVTNRTDEYIDVRFGYRTLKSGELALVVWVPDLVERSTHIARWSGFHLEDSEWAENDERFVSWVRRYIEGDWDVDSGPGHYLSATMHTINALTCESIGKPLFNVEPQKGAPAFPSADNTHRYEDAHKEVYGYLIDGLNKEAIKELSRQLGRPVNVDNLRTRTALETVLPALKIAASFQMAYDVVSENRRKATHGVRLAAERYNAFEQFTRDLQLCVDGLKELVSILSRELSIDAENAIARHDARRALPTISASPDPHFSINEASRMVGRTVGGVEVGHRSDIYGAHRSEAIIIHFTDGSILGIDTGSNAGNLEIDHEQFKADDFHVDFILAWVPPKE